MATHETKAAGNRSSGAAQNVDDPTAALDPSIAQIPKVSLSEAQQALITIDEVVEMMLAEALDEAQTEQEAQHRRGQLKEMLSLRLEALNDADSAIDRMLNRVSWQIRQKLTQDMSARYHRGLAAQFSQSAKSSDQRIHSIRQAIRDFLINRGETKYVTTFHRMHLSTIKSVVIDWEQVPGIEGLIELNAKYPGIVSAFKLNESGVLIDVSFRLPMIKKLIEVSEDAYGSDDEDAAAAAQVILADLCFARVQESKTLAVPTVSEAAAKRELNVVETEYGLVEGGE